MLTIKGNLWLENNNKQVIGKGRAQLLAEINNCGSIAQAAKNLNITYRKAWCMVKEINANSTKPVITKIVGGKYGGGAILTLHGINLLNNYNLIANAFYAFIKQSESIINYYD